MVFNEHMPATTALTLTPQEFDTLPGASVRQFPSEPFREVEAVTFDGSNAHGTLFFVVRFVGGGAVTLTTADTIEVQP